MHLRNVRIGPICHLRNSRNFSEGHDHGNNNWRAGLYVCNANRNLFIRFLAKGRVEDGEFKM